jgi:hypothetical protein
MSSSQITTPILLAPFLGTANIIYINENATSVDGILEKGSRGCTLELNINIIGKGDDELNHIYTSI